MRKSILIVVFGLASLCQFASAQNAYPSKPITIIVPFATGTQTDAVGRALAQLLSQRVGRAISFNNRPGTAGVNVAAAAPADGYTILIASDALSLPTGAFAPIAPLARAGDESTWFGAWVPAGTPQEIVSRLNTILSGITTLPDFGEQVAKQGLRALSGTPADMVLLQQRPRAAPPVEGSASPLTPAANPLATAAPAQAALAAKPSAFGSGNSYAVGIEAFKNKEYATALRLLRPHANDGQAWSQMALGAIYLNGSSVPKDSAEGYKWVFLAAAAGLKEAAELLPALERELSPEQVSEGKARANKWKR